MIRRLAPVLVAGLALAACSAGDGSTSAPGSAPVPPQASIPDQTTTPTEPSAAVPSATGPGDAPSTSAPESGSGVVPSEVPEALRFSAPLVGGGDIELGALAGRPVLLWFWAPW